MTDRWPWETRIVRMDGLVQRMGWERWDGVVLTSSP